MGDVFKLTENFVNGSGRWHIWRYLECTPPPYLVRIPEHMPTFCEILKTIKSYFPCLQKMLKTHVLFLTYVVYESGHSENKC
jgi:hypothetical protein